MATSLPSVKIALLGTTEPIDLQVVDADNNAVDATVLKLNITDINGDVKWSDDFFSVGSKIVKPAGTIGIYYYPFGIIAEQTKQPQDFLFQWYVQSASADIPTTVIQNTKVLLPLVFQDIPYLRLTIDKARKLVDPANDVFLGYTDAQLVMYLEDGINIINGYQPETVCGFNINNFPYGSFRHLANEAALLAGVMSQQLFAVDTDLPNYNDQGITFVIAHSPQLAQFFNQVTQRLDKMIPMMKMQFVSTGSIHVETGPSFRLAALISAAPSGALFRNMYFQG